VSAAQAGAIGGMDFDAAITAHRQWRRRLLDFVAGGSHEQLDSAVVGRDDQCALGKWIYGTCQPALGRHPLCENLRSAHRAFHECAGEIIRKRQSGDIARARHLLGGDFARRSEETIHHIEAMRVGWQQRGDGDAQSAPPARQLPPAKAAVGDEDEWEEF